jgi:hypothetical protein
MARQTSYEAMLANTADSLKLWQEVSELQRRSAEVFLDPNLGALPLRLGDLQARTIELQAKAVRLNLKVANDTTRWFKAFSFQA